ncbi:MAG TPA: glycosyltransferase family A protein [Dehalococcoidia bacterium]
MSGAGVSVVIPVFNGAKFLHQAIQSALAQTLPAEEVIVVDDGSTDRSGETADGFGGIVRCLRREHGGQSAARNAGAAVASADLIAFLDADDVWLPDKLRIQASRLVEEPGLECVFTLVDHFYEKGEAQGLDIRVGQAAGGLLPSTILIRREAFARVGPFDEGLDVGEFIDWYVRAQDLGLRCEMIQRVLVRRRIHAGNVSHRLASRRDDYLRVVRAGLQRRRGDTSGEPGDI